MGDHSRPSPCRGPLSRLVETLVMATVLWLMAAAWLIETRTVTSGSMAPTFDGSHRMIECQDCHFQFACGLDQPPPLGGRAVCPNCGFADNEVAKYPDIVGDGLLINKAAFLARSPRRWEAVACWNPASPSQVMLKRVVGLPGETCEFQDGDLFINDRPAQKSLDQLREMRVLVYDDRFRSHTASLPRRFVAGKNWLIDGGVYTHQPNESGAVSMLDYHHWRRAPGDPNKAESAPVDDNYGYDPFRSRRVEDCHAALDLMLSCRLRSSGHGDVMVRLADGRGELLALIGPSHRRALLFIADGEGEFIPIHDITIASDLLSTDSLLEAALCDGRFLMALDGEELFPPTPYLGDDTPFQPTAAPISLGAGTDELDLKIWDLKIWRDVYYDAPPGLGPHWGCGKPCQLEGDEYFVVGDNVPASEDSRSWPRGPGAPGNLLVGKPFLTYFPRRWLGWGMGLQVPRWERIRYIP